MNIRFDDDKKHEIKDHVGHDDVLCIRFAHHGKLPGPATIRNYVGDRYEDGHKLYLYYFDEEQDKVLRIGDKPLEVKDGYIEYTITHCSTYFVMDDKLTNVEMDETSLADASVSVLDKDYSGTLARNTSDENPPVTGDRTPIYMYVGIMLLGVVMMFVSKKYRVYK